MGLLYTTQGLDARLEGLIKLTAVANTTTTDYYYFPECEFNGVEFYAWDSNKNDKIALYIEYWNGTSWVIYKKFGKDWYIIPNQRVVVTMFPSSLTTGTRLRLDYTCGANPVDFILNGYKFVKQVKVDMSNNETGEDW